MTVIVMDSSAALKWALPEPFSDKAEKSNSSHVSHDGVRAVASVLSRLLARRPSRQAPGQSFPAPAHDNVVVPREQRAGEG